MRHGKWPVNIVGLGLIVAGVLFMYFLNFVGVVIGLPMVLGGIMALFMTYRRKKTQQRGLARADASRATRLREHVVVRARPHVAALAQLL